VQDDCALIGLTEGRPDRARVCSRARQPMTERLPDGRRVSSRRWPRTVSFVIVTGLNPAVGSAI